jgi:hypothetical protein
MDYEVIPDFLYLNEPIYRRITGVPQARLVSSVLSVNAEPASQDGDYASTNAARAHASEPDITISRDEGERLVRVSYGEEPMRSVLNPANANRVYYTQRLLGGFYRLGTLVRHFLRTGDRNITQTELFFSDKPNRSYSVNSLFYDPLPNVPTKGGYKRSTTSRNNKKKQKLIRRTRRQNRSRK